MIVPIFKEKGDIQDCGNYRGIKMISHTMKIWERVIDRRLREETTIGEEQFGFMPGRRTTDAIFAARQVIIIIIYIFCIALNPCTVLSASQLKGVTHIIKINKKCKMCNQYSNDRETPGNAERTAPGVYRP